MKKYFKISLIIVSIVFMFAVAGCQSSSAERLVVLQTAYTAVKEASSTAGDQIALLQTAVGQLQIAVADGNMPADFRLQASDALAKTQAKLQSLQQIKVQADKAMGDYQKTIDQIAAADANKLDWSDEAKALGEGAKAIAPFTGSAAGYVYLGGSLLVIIGSIGTAMKKAKDEKKAKTEASQANTALDQVVTANDIFLKAAPVDTVQKFKEAQNLIQTAPTVQKVAVIKAL